MTPEAFLVRVSFTAPDAGEAIADRVRAVVEAVPRRYMDATRTTFELDVQIASSNAGDALLKLREVFADAARAEGVEPPEIGMSEPRCVRASG
jgi:hypothetical protein